MSVFPNLIFRVRANPIKIPERYFADIDELIIKFIWNGKRSTIAKTMLKEKSKVGGITLLYFKNYSKVTVSQDSVVLVKIREFDYWNRIGSPKIDSHKYSQLIFDIGAKAIQ